MADRETILRHIETAVDVDEWAVIGVKENFEKLEQIEKILEEAPNTFYFRKISEVLDGNDD